MIAYVFFSISQTVLAKALYDNAAESPEELAFRKGDILMVLEQEQEGGPGWWLCSLHGRQGIAPANRLRLLQTAAGQDRVRAPSVDSVYLSPTQQNVANGHRVEEADVVYLSPPSISEGVYQSPGGASGPNNRPRSHSSSGPRPRAEWAEMVSEGRPRSPSLRGRAGEGGTMYQTPATMAQLGGQYRSQSLSESVYLTPSAVPRPGAEAVNEATYLTPRDSSTISSSDGCYLVPRPAMATLPGDDLYQTPTSAAPMPVPQDLITSQLKVAQETPGMYQTPTQPGTAMTPQPERKLPSGSAVLSPASGPNLKTPPATKASPRPQNPCSSPHVGRGNTSNAALRGSPLLVRGGKAGLPGSPNFTRKPPPPAPPVRSVTRKDLPQQAAAPATKPAMQASLTPSQVSKDETQKQRSKDKGRKKEPEMMKKEEKTCPVFDDGQQGDQVRLCSVFLNIYMLILHSVFRLKG